VGIRERINASLTDIRARGQRLVQLNLELLAAELKAKGKKYGAAVGMFVGAALLSVYAIGCLLATIALALALVLPLWLSMLIVTLVLFLVIAILLLAGRSQLRKVKSPAPERAVAEAKTTADAFKTGLRDTAQRVKPKPGPLTPTEQLAADAKAAEAKWPGATPKTQTEGTPAAPAEGTQAAPGAPPADAAEAGTQPASQTPPGAPQTDAPAAPTEETKD
jgi:hypothetical protein